MPNSHAAAPSSEALAEITRKARNDFARRVSGDTSVAWWDAVVITASTPRQAELYRAEIDRRLAQGKLPAGVAWHSIPDPDGRRIGSGGGTLNVLRALGHTAESWWSGHRVLVLHSGGDSRRLPQYSSVGKLFTALPVRTPWGDPSTVFDELLALSTDWAAALPSGLLVGSGDVVLTFDSAGLQFHRPGICGVAMRQPLETGLRHGVYVTDEHGRVYTYLQKPSPQQVRAAGGLLPGGQVSLDIGLMRFDAPVTARLTRLAQSLPEPWPAIDLYTHFAFSLVGAWRPEASDPEAYRTLYASLEGVPFSCSLVEGEFTHAGATPDFRRLMTGEDPFLRLYAMRDQLSRAIVESNIPDAEIAPGALVIECDLPGPLRVGAGAILHGLSGIAGPMDIPPAVVLNQLTVSGQGFAGSVIRVYGTADDPKQPIGKGTWLDAPLLKSIEALALTAEAVWPGIDPAERTLWNAELFPVGSVDECWECARWFLGMPSRYSLAEWSVARKLSLASSAWAVDNRALAETRIGRMRHQWTSAALSLARSGADIRPLLANPAGVAPLVQVARMLESDAAALDTSSPSEAASRYFQAGLFFERAGLAEDHQASRGRAFACVRRAVELGVAGSCAVPSTSWACDGAAVSAPPRIDLAGGWSDTPPFCNDWGGTVLNIALELNGAFPIRASVKRIDEPIIRCISDDTSGAREFHDCEEVIGSCDPSSPFIVPCVALGALGIVRKEERLAQSLLARGGGLEIRTSVDLPVGSGLGTSSILAAAVVRALSDMLGLRESGQQLSDRVMLVEQRMTTGGGWQDQAGGIYPGAKLLATGPGLRQRIRVRPLAWSAEQQAAFASRMVLYYTGIRRMAKGLLAQVVGAYLARETQTVQVLHSIKTLAAEMACALEESDWPYAGRLMNRHWELNKMLDPNTTNAPINALLKEVAPYVAGAKLAGAGGGGFMILLAHDPDAAAQLQSLLTRRGEAAVYQFRIAAKALASVGS